MDKKDIERILDSIVAGAAGNGFSEEFTRSIVEASFKMNKGQRMETLSAYGQWLEICRTRQKIGLQEWAFCLDLKTSVYKSIITGDVYPDEAWPCPAMATL